MNYTLKVYENEKTISSSRTTKIRRFSHFIQAAKNLEATKYYLCVDYGNSRDSDGRLTKFINEGYYDDLERLSYALQCFIEDTYPMSGRAKT